MKVLRLLAKNQHRHSAAGEESPPFTSRLLTFSLYLKEEILRLTASG